MKKISILFTILCCLASVHLSSQNDEDCDEDVILHSFEEWKKIYGKSYSSNEEQQRKKIFYERYERIKEHNKRYKAKEVTYLMGQNEYSDLTNEEFKDLVGIKSTQISEIDEVIVNDTNIKRRVKRQAPANFDWRNTGKVTSAEDQGVCGSSYAFAAISAVESQVAISCGNLYRLSAQQIVDCSWSQGNGKCMAGSPQISFRYLINAANISTAASYPYTSGYAGEVGSCPSIIANSKAKVVGYKNFPQDESVLLSAVASMGPITVGMNVNFYSFQDYHSGIWNEPDCSNSPGDIDHYMVIVGYGTNTAGEKFWIIKNSWSTSWGNLGFVRVPRGVNKCCVVIDTNFCK